MARTALAQLQDEIEAVRSEAFVAGYAAAMQVIREFAAKPAPGATRPQRRPRAATATTAKMAARPTRQCRTSGATPTPQRPARATGRRSQHGSNARLIEEVLQSNAPRALRPAEIRSALQGDKGVAMAFASIRHALGQLEERHVAEQVAGSKTWRYRGQGRSAAN